MTVTITKACLAPKCERAARSRGLCGKHYQRLVKRGSIDDPPKPFEVCTVEGCLVRHHSRGLCTTHISRLKATGSLAKPVRSLGERFWPKVNRRAPDDCWPWTGRRNAYGYGIISAPPRSGRRYYIASRVSLELTGVEIPDGMVVRHKCDNPPCVNPAHLEVGTVADNARDMADRRRSTIGGRNPQAKLTEDDLRGIRGRLALGESQVSVALVYGVSKTTINDIARGRTWARVA
ncbi:MAG: HNH endonuclease [Tessaracoccus sp.]|uniref:HNH endonuclease n=1 Tax=Tessaracoccus sp. TaxID=1971211 RepID=UPI001EC76A78|nr:HNH endonuclease [Tessaracoccus sp.]MBK7822847.1 HNH endonuclease [Tessaracoccus sp.]